METLRALFDNRNVLLCGNHLKNRSADGQVMLNPDHSGINWVLRGDASISLGPSIDIAIRINTRELQLHFSSSFLPCRSVSR